MSAPDGAGVASGGQCLIGTTWHDVAHGDLQTRAAPPAVAGDLVAAVRVSIIVMAYNEVASIAGVLREIEMCLLPSGMPYEVIVVDDGSSDGTGDVGDAFARAHPHVRVIHHERNSGIGEVYRSGFGSACGELVTFLPADAQFPATIVAQFVSLADEADLVLGYLPNVRRSMLATCLSAAERCMYALMFGRLPRFQGIMMFRRSLLGELDVAPGGRGWGVLMEIIVKAVRAGKTVVSVPTEFRPRANGGSKVNDLKSIWSNLLQAVALQRSL